jgi:hypothetical protein
LFVSLKMAANRYTTPIRVRQVEEDENPTWAPRVAPSNGNHLIIRAFTQSRLRTPERLRPEQVCARAPVKKPRYEVYPRTPERNERRIQSVCAGAPEKKPRYVVYPRTPERNERRIQSVCAGAPMKKPRNEVYPRTPTHNEHSSQQLCERVVRKVVFKEVSFRMRPSSLFVRMDHVDLEDL